MTSGTCDELALNKGLTLIIPEPQEIVKAQVRDGNLKTLGLGRAWQGFKGFFRKSPRPETAKKSRIPRITEKGLARVEQYLNDILINQGLPEEFQSGERGMLERLRAGNRTLQDIEFYLHELKESAVFRRT